jgi:hypothetical protein
MQLQIADVLRRRVLANLAHDGREIVRGAQAIANRNVDLNEVRKIAKAKVLAQAGFVRRGGRHPIPLGELQQGGRAHRALEVDVNLRLRHAPHEGFEARIDGRAVVRHAKLCSSKDEPISSGSC